MLCPRCRLDRPFPSAFAHMSSEVPPWDASGDELSEPAAASESGVSPEPFVETMLCLECCTDLQAMMHALFPGQRVSITDLEAVSEAPRTQPAATPFALGSPKRSK